MKPTLTVACISLKSVWQAVSLRSALAALLLAPLAALHAKENSPGVPRLGKFRAGSFQALETSVSLASNAWN
jgi:hypothetical protein